MPLDRQYGRPILTTAGFLVCGIFSKIHRNRRVKVWRSAAWPNAIVVLTHDVVSPIIVVFTRESSYTAFSAS